VCTGVALGFLDILLNLLSADVSTNVDKPYMDVIMYVVSAMCVLNDDIADNSKEDLERPTKCQCHNYDHSHTKAAVWNDYLSHSSFRKNCVSKAIYKTIRSAVLKHPFFKKKNLIAVEGRLLGSVSNS